MKRVLTQKRTLAVALALASAFIPAVAQARDVDWSISVSGGDHFYDRVHHRQDYVRRDHRYDGYRYDHHRKHNRHWKHKRKHFRKAHRKAHRRAHYANTYGFHAGPRPYARRAQCQVIATRDYWRGHRAKIGVTQCFDRYGSPYTVHSSRHLIRYL